MSHAPGFSGMPPVGHRSSATTSASCARSSASATSRTRRTSPPMSRADSIRQTASIASRVAPAPPPLTPSSSRSPPRPERLRLPLAVDLGPQAFLLGAQLGRELLAEILGLEHGPDGHLDPAVERRALEPLYGLVDRPDLPDPVPGDDLLRLGERPVADGPLRAREPHPLPLGRRGEPVAGEHHACLHELFVELHHLRDQLLARHLPGLGVLVAGDEHHHAHHRLLLSNVGSPASAAARYGPSPGSNIGRTSASPSNPGQCFRCSSMNSVAIRIASAFESAFRMAQPPM